MREQICKSTFIRSNETCPLLPPPSPLCIRKQHTIFKHPTQLIMEMFVKNAFHLKQILRQLSGCHLLFKLWVFFPL